MDLKQVVDISIVAQSVVVVMTALVALRQLHLSRQERHLSALIDIFDDIYKVEEYARRETILFPQPNITPSQEDYRIVVDMFERIGFLARHKYIDRRLVYDMYGKLIADLWSKCSEFAYSERTRLGAIAYARDFESLAKYCTNLRRRRMAIFNLRTQAAGRTKRVYEQFNRRILECWNRLILMIR